MTSDPWRTCLSLVWHDANAAYSPRRSDAKACTTYRRLISLYYPRPRSARLLVTLRAQPATNGQSSGRTLPGLRGTLPSSLWITRAPEVAACQQARPGRSPGRHLPHLASTGRAMRAVTAPRPGPPPLARSEPHAGIRPGRSGRCRNSRSRRRGRPPGEVRSSEGQNRRTGGPFRSTGGQSRWTGGQSRWTEVPRRWTGGGRTGGRGRGYLVRPGGRLGGGAWYWQRWRC
jgi:hypothetical protein